MAATSKPRKKNYTDYKQTNKQDNKEINKQATYSRLSRLLHILHHWASKFTTMIIKHKQTTDYIHWASKIATSANKHADKIIYKTDSTSIEFKKG